MTQDPNRNPYRQNAPKEPDKNRRPKSSVNTVMTLLIVLLFVLFAFNFLGDGIRDALDPRTTRR